ncbi:hypothetical protein Tco_0078122 [Tanacetum coccineum]
MDYQRADLFTKALPVDRFNYLVRRLGMRCLSPQELDRLAKSHQNRRDLPRNTPLDKVEVLGMIEKRSKVRKGIVPTEMELVLEQTLQGTSYEVSRSTRCYRLSYSEIIDIEKVAVRSSLRLPNNKCALIEVILFSIHNDDGNPARANIKQALGSGISSIRRIERVRYGVSSLDTAYWSCFLRGLCAGVPGPLSSASLEDCWGAPLKGPIERLIRLPASLHELRHAANHPCGESTLVGHRSLHKSTQTPDIPT